MTNRKITRLISALLSLIMLLSSASAMADMVEVQSYVQAYSDSQGQSPIMTVGAGVYDMKPYNSEFYVFYTNFLGVEDVPIYIKVSDVQYVGASSSGDSAGEAGGTETGTASSSSASLSGAYDSTYEKEILSYTVPDGGLRVYADPSSSAAMTDSILAGVTVKLTYVGEEREEALPKAAISGDEEGALIETWYSTLYKDKPVYVKKSDLKLNASTISAGKSYQLRMEEDVLYYSSEPVASSDKAANPTGYVCTGIAAGTLEAGTTVYVTVNKTTSLTVADEVGSTSTKTYATWYEFTTVAGQKGYFKNPGIDDVIKGAMSAYTSITATSSVAYYATLDAAKKALGEGNTDNALIANDTLHLAEPVFTVWNTKTETSTTRTSVQRDVVYDLKLDTASKVDNGDGTYSYAWYTCSYYNDNGTKTTGYIKIATLDVRKATDGNVFKIRSSASNADESNVLDESCTQVKDLVKVDDLWYSCSYLSSTTGAWEPGYIGIGNFEHAYEDVSSSLSSYQKGGLLYDGTNKSYWPNYRTLMYKEEKLVERISSGFAVDQRNVKGITEPSTGVFAVAYRNSNGTTGTAYFKPSVTIDELKGSVSIFSSIGSTTDLEKFPTGFNGSASAWQGLYKASELTNKINYKTQTKTVDGVTYYRVTWYRVQYVDYNGNLATGYYENPAVYDDTAGDPKVGFGYYPLTSDAEAIGGSAFDTQNASGAETNLLKRLEPTGTGTTVDLYEAKSLTSRCYRGITVSDVKPLYGVKADDYWYEVLYNGKTYFVEATKVDETGEAVAVSDGTLTSASYYITIGADGAQLYTAANSAARYMAYDDTDATAPVLMRLKPGETVLVTKYGTGWYTIEKDGKLYYISAQSISNAAANGSTTAVKAWVNMCSMHSLPDGDAHGALDYGWYAVQKYNDNLYAIRWKDNVKYYIPAEAVTEIASTLPITTTGNKYSVVIGKDGGSLFKSKDNAIAWGQSKDYETKPAADQTLAAGTKVTVTQVYSFLYMLESSAGNMYLSLKDISMVLGNDDDGYLDKTQPSSGVSADDVLKGTTDASYTDTVLSYTVPAGGLWLYASSDATSGAYCVAAGATLNLSEAYGEPEYLATWYNGKQYFVRKADLATSETVSSGGKYTISLAKDVTTYSKLTTTTNATADKDPYGTGVYGDDKHALGTLPVGIYNVTAYKTLTFTAFNGSTFETVTYPTWYSFVNAAGNTVYFQNPELASIAPKAPAIKTGNGGTKLYYSVSRETTKSNGTYSQGTSSQYIVYAGLRATDTYSSYAFLNYDNNYDTTTESGWKSGRTSNSKDYRGETDYNNAAWDRVVPNEKVEDIKPYMYSSVTNEDGSKSYFVTWYSGTLYYNYNMTTKSFTGKRTVYFNTTTPKAVKGSITGGTLINATVTSGSSVSFTLSIPVPTTGEALYAAPGSGTSETPVIRTNPSGVGSVAYLPGIEYNEDWYKVLYNDEGWFVRKSDVKEEDVRSYASNETLSTSTMTVTIGASGAKLYSKPETNSSIIYESGYSSSGVVRYQAYEQNAVGSLPAGTTVKAVKYSSDWYSYADSTMTTYYFRAAAVANSVDDSTVDSYTLNIPSKGEWIRLYTSANELAGDPVESEVYLTMGSYNVRKVSTDPTWSRVLYNGLNYYFKTAEAEKMITFVATATSLGGGSFTQGLTYAAKKISDTQAVAYDDAHSEVWIDLSDLLGSKYRFTTSADTVKVYDATLAEKKDANGKQVYLPAGTYELEAKYIGSKMVYEVVLNGVKCYVMPGEIEDKEISFTTKAVLDLYNEAHELVYGADEYDAAGNALGLPIGTYNASSSYKVVAGQIYGEWIKLEKGSEVYYIKSSDVTRYTQIDASKFFTRASHVIEKNLVTANSDTNLYQTSTVSTAQTTQTKYKSSRRGALLNKKGADALLDAATATTGSSKTMLSNWKGLYNKAVRINDNWASVVIPESDPVNGHSISYNSSKKTLTVGSTSNAGTTFYVFLGESGETLENGSIEAVNGTAVGGADSAIGGAIATVSDGKTYTIIIGAGGAEVFNNAKLQRDPSTALNPILAAGTKLSGTKLTAAYKEAGAADYTYQSVYKITYNGYTAYISAADVAAVEKGDDEEDRKAEAAGETTKDDDVSADSEPLDLAVGDPELRITLANTIVVYAAKDTNLATATSIAAGSIVGVTRPDEKWYQIKKTDGSIYYIPVSELTMEDVASSERISDGTGYITKLLAVNVQSGSSLNMRKTATTSGTIIAYLSNGAYLTNLGYTTDANGAIWYKVGYNNLTGYVHGSYVAPVLSGSSSWNSASSLKENIGLALTVNTDNVYIRTGAGPEYPTLNTLAKGSIVVPTDAIQGSDGLTWYKMIYNGTTAYIRYDYVSGGTSNTASLSGNAAIRLNSTNMRSGAGLSFQVVGRLSKNTVVTILSTSTDSDGTVWYRITSGDKTGYVRNDLLRSLTTSESNGLINDVVNTYKVLKVGSRGSTVTTLQQALISKGYLPSGEADGIYGSKTMNAVKSFQSASGLTANGTADATTQAKLYGTYTGTDAGLMKGNVNSLDWFANGYTLINAYPNVSIYDCNTGVTWNAKYINGKNHADVIPASATDAALLTAYSITGSYVRRPVIVTINGVKYAGSMYAVGHGTTSYCSWFSGVMCVHFTGSKTHTSGKVDADHQTAINYVLTNFN